MPRSNETRRAVAAELEASMAELTETVNALKALLLPPEANPEMERVTTP